MTELNTGAKEFHWRGMGEYGVHWLAATETYTGHLWGFLVIVTAQISGLDGDTTGTFAAIDIPAGTFVPTPNATTVKCESGTIICILSELA